MSEIFEIEELKYNEEITLRLNKEDGTKEEVKLNVKINSNDFQIITEIYEEMSKREIGEQFELEEEFKEKNEKLQELIFGEFLETAKNSFTNFDFSILSAKIIVDIVGTTGINGQKEVVKQGNSYAKKMPKISK